VTLKTLDEAKGQGYVSLSPCVPVMGIHAAKIVGGIPQDPILLFSDKGELIGAELESMTEQPYPPWEHRPDISSMGASTGWPSWHGV